jgi:hypothetical protein
LQRKACREKLAKKSSKKMASPAEALAVNLILPVSYELIPCTFTPCAPWEVHASPVLVWVQGQAWS